MTTHVAERLFSSKTYGVLGEDKIWDVVCDMEEFRRLADNPWESRAIISRGMHKTFEKAYETAMKSLLAKLGDLKGDLFNLSAEESAHAITNPVKDNETSET
jgi:hypothetical protein